MTAAAILFLLLLALSSLTVYRLAGWLTGRFFRLRRDVFLCICVSAAAVFFAAGCIGGIFALQALRSAEYARGLSEGAAVKTSAQSGSTDAGAEPDTAAWRDGYGEGFTDGFAAAAERSIRTPQTEEGESVQSEPMQSDRMNDTPPPDTSDSTVIDPDEGPDNESGETPVPEPTPETEETPDAPEKDDDTSDETEDVAGGTTVYYTSSGSVLHRDRNCSYLKKAKEVLSGSAADAPSLPYCSRCG